MGDWESTRATAEHTSLDRYLARVAIRRVLDHPVRWTVLFVERVGRFMLPARTWFVQSGLTETGTFSPVYVLATSLNVFMFALNAWLFLVALRTRTAVMAVGPVIVFSHLFVYATTYVSPRYALTVTPVLLAGAMLAFWQIGSFARAKDMLRA